MSYFEGLAFYLLLVPVLLLAGLLGWKEKPLGRYSLVVSILFALLIFLHEPLQFLYLVLFCAWSYGMVRGYLFIRKKGGRDTRWFHLILASALAPLVLCKVTPCFGKNLFGFIGISYLTFRVIQIIIETYDGVITEMGTEDFFSFLLFFPSVSSGPIDRSRRFLADRGKVRARNEYMELCGRGIGLFLVGMVYKMVLAAGAYHVMGYLEGGDSLLLLIGYAYAYGIYLFFDFAGYSRMAVGVSCILGIETPDNFRAPFLAEDIRDFWDRWHITLSHWFRDYIFTRFVMFSSRKKWFGSRLGRACAGFFVNMGIMGLWHGLSVNYIIYGLYHGALLAGTEVFQKKSAWYKKNKKKEWYRLLSWFVTIQEVMFGFLIFSGHLI